MSVGETVMNVSIHSSSFYGLYYLWLLTWLYFSHQAHFCCVIYDIWQFWLWNWDRWYPLSVYLLTQWFYEGVQTTNVQVDKIFNKLHPWMISVTHKDISPVLSFFQRCVHYLLAAFLSDPCTEGPLQKLLHLTLPVQRRYLAGIPQQCRQPCHIHHFQHWISQSLHQDPALLVQKDERCQLSKNKKIKTPDINLSSEVRKSWVRSQDKEVCGRFDVQRWEVRQKSGQLISRSGTNFSESEWQEKCNK